MQKFWKLTNQVEGSDSELVLDGPISQESWWGDEVTPQEFRNELKNIKGDKLTVILNSGGGDVFAGLSIYNALRELDKEVTIRVDGLAASIASIIAMAGDKIIMSPGSMMMIHRPSVFAAGNTEDLEKAIDVLKTIEDSIIPIYTAKSGLSAETIADMLDAETWMSAERAVELGFADSVAVSAKKQAEVDSPQNALAGNFSFSMSATKASLEDLVKKVAAKDETEDEVITDEEVKVVEPPVEVPTPEKEVETDKEEVVVTPEPKNKATEEIKMSTQEEIAKGQVITPENQAKVDAKASATELKTYLKSKTAIQDFANVLSANAGGTAAEVKDAWGEHLKAQMAVSNIEILLPTALITAIEDAFEKGGEIWNLVNKTGLTVFRNAIDTATGEVSRAKGNVRGTTKGEETITLADRVVRAQFIYKYLTLNKEDLRENRDTGALLRYVLTELPNRIVREVERAIVIGDGRASGSEFKINSFTAIKADAQANNAYATRYVPAVAQSKYKTMVEAADLVLAEGSVYLVAKKGFLTSIRLEQGVNGGYLFAPGVNLGDAFELAGVMTPDWMAEDTTNDAYLFVPSAYTTVGDSTIESFTNFVLKENKQEYLQEIYAGGALTSRKAAVAIAVTPTA